MNDATCVCGYTLKQIAARVGVRYTLLQYHLRQGYISIQSNLARGRRRYYSEEDLATFAKYFEQVVKDETR